VIMGVPIADIADVVALSLHPECERKFRV
jgi:hypothetical protein